MQKIGIGRIVHYVMAPGNEVPAMIVESWGNVETKPGIAVNLQVFIDGSNSRIKMTGEYSFPSAEEAKAGIMWRTSSGYDESAQTPGSWHWPEIIE